MKVLLPDYVEEAPKAEEAPVEEAAVVEEVAEETVEATEE